VGGLHDSLSLGSTLGGNSGSFGCWGCSQGSTDDEDGCRERNGREVGVRARGVSGRGGDWDCCKLRWRFTGGAESWELSCTGTKALFLVQIAICKDQENDETQEATMLERCTLSSTLTFQRCSHATSCRSLLH
jgi:hypothetical protein